MLIVTVLLWMVSTGSTLFKHAVLKKYLHQLNENNMVETAINNYPNYRMNSV